MHCVGKIKSFEMLLYTYSYRRALYTLGDERKNVLHITNTIIWIICAYVYKPVIRLKLMQWNCTDQQNPIKVGI